MKKSIWFQRWWVFIPLALSLLLAGWIFLGMTMGLELMPSPDPGSVPDYPAWMLNVYYAIYYPLLAAVFGGVVLIDNLTGGMQQKPGVANFWIARLEIALTFFVYCLLPYGLSLFLKWRGNNRAKANARIK